MSPLSILWGAVAGACVALAATQLVIARRLRAGGMRLLFVVSCFAVAGAIIGELGMYHADSTDTYGIALKWSVALQVVWALAMTWFLVDYTKIERRTTAWLMTAVFGIGLVIHCLSPAGLTHGSIDQLHRFQLPWGEWISLGSGTEHPLWFIPSCRASSCRFSSLTSSCICGGRARIPVCRAS
jgi:hypothetical protein